MKKTLLATAVIASTLVVSGCASTRLGEFTTASTKNVPNLRYSATGEHRTEGKSCLRFVFFFPMGDSNARIQRAMDDAIENGHKKGIAGDLLVNARINHKAWSAGVYGEDCIYVEGDLVTLSAQK